jgi:Zn-dependent protease with chaperone function
MQFRQHQRAAQRQTVFLLAWFTLLLIALIAAVNLVLAVAYKVFMPFSMGFPALFFETNSSVVLLFVLGGCLVETQRLRDGGGAGVARWLGGREVTDPDDATERRLLNVVDEMALASGQPVPQVFVMPREDAINAFVAGWGAPDLALSVTRGALDRLTRAELQGLVAHEFGHIKQEDLPLHMRLLALVWGLSLVHSYGQSLMAPDDNGVVRPLPWLLGLVFATVGWLGWMAGRLLQAAVSRQREYLADASAIQFTRTRDGLGNVLRKLWHDQQMLAGRMRHPAADVVAAMLVHEPGSQRWLATHPRLSERILRVCGSVLPPLPAPLVRMESVEPRRPRLATSPGEGLLAAQGDTGPADPIRQAEQSRQQRIADDREALMRLRNLSGPTERRLVVLALMMNQRNQREHKLWQRMAEGVNQPQRILEDVAALLPAHRVPEFERLAAAIASEPLDQRRTLVESARDLLRADGRVSPRERLWWLALRHRMSDKSRQPAFMRPVTGQGQSLTELPPDALHYVTALSAYLARFIPAEDSSAGQAWLNGVMSRCGRAHTGTYSAPPDADALMHALAGVQELSWMLRPLLLKAWVEEAINHSPNGVLSDDTADALRLSASLIDAPLPPMLEAHYPRP